MKILVRYLHLLFGGETHAAHAAYKDFSLLLDQEEPVVLPILLPEPRGALLMYIQRL